MLLSIVCFFSLLLPAISHAQTQPNLPSYWQYAASGELNHVLAADVNYDGIKEILIADENGRVDLIGADGQRIWRFQADEPIYALQAINLNANSSESGSQPLSVLVGIRNFLILLDANGNEIWRARLAPYDIAAAQLTSSGLESEQIWLDTYEFLPQKIAAFQNSPDSPQEILVLLKTGQILRYDAQGNLLWQYIERTTPTAMIPPQLLVTDFDNDGQDEIVLSIFGPRRFSQLIYIDDEIEKWAKPHSGRISALEVVEFNPGEKLIAAGTSLGDVHLYQPDRQRVWLRTLNTPVTSMTAVPQADGEVLAVGSEVGSVVVFDAEGRRVWANNLAEAADRPILSLTAGMQSAPGNQPALAAILAATPEGSDPADIVLLDKEGQVLSKLANVDSIGLSQFIDSDQDGISELLITHFATLELLGLGVGNNQNVQEWEYALNAAPAAALFADFDGDNEEELIVSTQDGRIHNLSNDRAIRWLHDTNDIVTHIALLPNTAGDPAGIVFGRNQPAAEAISPPLAWVELRENRGERVWQQPVDTPITALTIGDILPDTAVDILVGTEDGRTLIFDTQGQLAWTYALPESDAAPIRQVIILGLSDNSRPEIIVVTDQEIYAFNPAAENNNARNIGSFPNGIQAVYPIARPGNEDLSLSLLVLENDGTLHGLNWRGVEMTQWNWPQRLENPLTASVSLDSATRAAADLLQDQRSSFLLATENGQVKQLDINNNQPNFPWQLETFNHVTNLSWHDSNLDGIPDLALIGNSNGRIWLYDQIQTQTPNLAFEPIDLFSSIFALSVLNREASQAPDLLAITENGLVQLFREQENRPPLLTNPVVEASLGSYNISVNIQDVEADSVKVGLEIQDQDSGEWLPMGEQSAANGSGTLFWPVATPINNFNEIHYRFNYDDGFYQGTITPPPGPAPVVNSQLSIAAPFIIFGLLLLGLLLIILYLRQAQTPNARARRFFRRLQQNPAQILLLLEKKYSQTQGSPDFLLYLANQARQANDRYIANLADGLYLLPDRPQAGLSIMNRTLDALLELEPIWMGLERWQMTYKTSQALLDAPSITELVLLLPQVKQLIGLLEQQSDPFPVETLLPILTNLRGSERVDLAEDRLVYLNEAATSIKRTQQDLPTYPQTIERAVVQVILRRWSGLVSASIAEQQGQANLVVALKTKRLAPNKHTDIALEIHNNGRSAAENIIINLDQNPAFILYSSPQTIPFLPPGRTRQMRFTIEPQVIDRFRLGITISYDDRNQTDRTIEFGDMVHLLSPVRDFRPIVNPYMPGTPLRPKSMLFYGREDLFEFIAESSSNRPQRSALILVGQRRTGKTSALLRLKDNLPSDLLPVYIDCQSLGVTPGIPALLQEFAWYIADALALYNINIEVPPLAEWQHDATFIFQRQFLPQVAALLPAKSSILLVFDEFEAFESLVEDGILPPTIFTYLRHLMQHVENLSFIFVGTRRLEEMTSDYWSVLFNIALYRKIDFLDVDAATRLITEPVAPNLVYDDLALDKILRVTAGHPYFLQLVCYTLVKRANSEKTGYVTISDVNAAVSEMLSLGEVHFAYLWQRSTHTERALLTAVAHLMDQNIPFHPEELLQHLEPYDIHIGPAEITTALNRLVERDIMREFTEQAITLYELKLGLVGLWVAQNKSLSKLYAEGQAPMNGSEPVRLVPEG